jgi:hypothetical protein
MSGERGHGLSAGGVIDRVNHIVSVHKAEGAMNDDQRAGRNQSGKGRRKQHPST